MPDLYPDINPYEHGLLDVGDGNSIYWERCGNAEGKPAVYVHGGPGSGSSVAARRFFDPSTYNVVLFDQRGCGRSRPLLTERSQLVVNKTQDLIRDLELLREHLSIRQWTILGISWGTTLSLAYAQMYPRRVSALILACVTTTSQREVDWITCDVGRLFPEQWERFASHVAEHLKRERIVHAYAELLFDDDPAVSAAAASEWCAWEDAHVSLAPGRTQNPKFLDPDFRLRFARLVTHYWSHAAFLGDGELMRNVVVLNGVPGVLIHGRYDVSSPLEIPWQLHHRWTGSELHIIEDAGHGAGSIADKIVAALDQAASRSAP